MLVSLQQLFDSQVEFDTKSVGLLNSMINLQQDYDHETVLDSFSPSYFQKMKEIADEFELDYTEPRFRGGLKGVDSSPTFH